MHYSIIVSEGAPRVALLSRFTPLRPQNMILFDQHCIPAGLFAEVAVVDRQKAGELADASIGAAREAKIDKGVTFNSRHYYRKYHVNNQRL